MQRTWTPGAPRLLFVMLNPSTGTETEDDPTLRRCRGFAKAWGHGGFDVVNIFALRSTNPEALYAHPDPIGPDNDAHILRAHALSTLTIAAWGGTHGDHLARGRDVARMLAATGKPVHSLTVCANGHPGHPLYVPGKTIPDVFAFPEAA